MATPNRRKADRTPVADPVVSQPDVPSPDAPEMVPTVGGAEPAADTGARFGFVLPDGYVPQAPDAERADAVSADAPADPTPVPSED